MCIKSFVKFVLVKLGLEYPLKTEILAIVFSIAEFG